MYPTVCLLLQGPRASFSNMLLVRGRNQKQKEQWKTLRCTEGGREEVGCKEWEFQCTHG